MAFMQRDNRDRDREKPEKRERKDRRISTRKKPCRFCRDSEIKFDFRSLKILNEFFSERCKVSPRRMSGNCQFHQTRVVEAINRARHLGLLPYTITHAVRDF
jgi:small subunit ribosomal protein S18